MRVSDVTRSKMDGNETMRSEVITDRLHEPSKGTPLICYESEVTRIRPFLSDFVGRTLSVLKLYLRIQQRQTLALLWQQLSFRLRRSCQPLPRRIVCQYKAEWYTKGTFSSFYY